MSLAFLDGKVFASMLSAADGDMDRMIDEMKRSDYPEVSAASLPTQSKIPALAPSSNVQGTSVVCSI